MYQNWGLNQLYERLEHERTEELHHADLLIKRILFLNGTPNVAAREALKIGDTVPKMLQNDLDYEIAVVGRLRKAIAICEAQKDYDSRRLLVELLRDTEEDHAHWLEIQLGLIQRLGLENYIQSATGSLNAGGKSS